jgi:rfaE bifunctional protein nucleotidyltransferase chain/domain
MNFREKIMGPAGLARWREKLRSEGKKLVVTNGCFDLLHVGHVTYLEAARNLGDALLVGINADATVRRLKGAGRPINSENDRAAVLAALQSVDAVCIFPEPDARGFLLRVQPDIYAKGGDYTIDTINQDERRLLESIGCKIVIVGGVPGRSTTQLLSKMSGRKLGDNQPSDK